MENSINIFGPLRILNKDEKIFVIGLGGIWEQPSHASANKLINQISNRTWTGIKINQP